MSEEKRFSRESFIYVFGEALSKSLAFILLPVYASYLSLDDFAVLSLVSVVWPVIVIILGQGFSTYLVRGFFDSSDQKRFFGTVISFSMLMGLMIALTVHLFGPFIFERIFKEVTYKPYLQYGVFFAVFRLYFIHVVSIYRAKRQAKTAVSLSLVFFLINLVAVLIAIYILDSKLIGILNAQLVAYILVATIYTLKVLPDISFHFQLSVLVPGIWFVLPLLPHALSGWTINYVSRIFILKFMSLNDLAVYSVAAQLALILSVINNGLNQAWVPFVYANYKKEDFRLLLSKSAKKILLLVMLVGSVLILFTKELLQIMGKTEFLAATYILPILLLSYVFQMIYFIYASIIICHNQPKLLPIISVSSGVIVIILNILLIPLFGMYGAALCTNISFMFMVGLAYLFSMRFVKIEIFNLRMFYFLLFLIIVLIFSLTYMLDANLFQRIVVNIFMVSGMIGLLLKLKLLNLKNIKEIFQRS